jgi:hypothetical protein
MSAAGTAVALRLVLRHKRVRSRQGWLTDPGAIAGRRVPARTSGPLSELVSRRKRLANDRTEPLVDPIRKGSSVSSGRRRTRAGS